MMIIIFLTPTTRNKKKSKHSKTTQNQCNDQVFSDPYNCQNVNHISGDLTIFEHVRVKC